MAFSSNKFLTVDQLKRTKVGNPNMGSIFLLKNFFVVGSEKMKGMDEKLINNKIDCIKALPLGYPEP
jgi:hypothetical protein